MNVTTIHKAAQMPEVPLSEWQIRCMVKSGECPGFRVGNRFYVHVDQLLEKLDAIARTNGAEVYAQ